MTVGRAYGLADAALAEAMLTAHGIKVFPDIRYSHSMLWHLTHAFGVVELRVPVSMAGDALDLLADFQAEPRPKSPARRLFITAVALVVLVIANFPPPARGFYASGLRRVSAPSAASSGSST
ncbi:hypothetical protein [Pelagibius sp.]|uniref:hypothetical protein n=1 Tax=Pelagibius sp. TaxID=1931238 RepID=UPI003BAFF205